MALFEKGNEFWKARATHGRDMLFASPTMLWESACEYFQWCDDNPLFEGKICSFQGVNVVEKIPKLRAYTMSGLCLFLDCSQNYFRQFKIARGEDNPDFVTIIEKIEETIYNQKFTAAAADLLNPNIIARELGLSDKTEGTTITYNAEVTQEEAKIISKALDEKY